MIGFYTLHHYRLYRDTITHTIHGDKSNIENCFLQKTIRELMKETKAELLAKQFPEEADDCLQMNLMMGSCFLPGEL